MKGDAVNGARLKMARKLATRAGFLLTSSPKTAPANPIRLARFTVICRVLSGNCSLDHQKHSPTRRETSWSNRRHREVWIVVRRDRSRLWRVDDSVYTFDRGVYCYPDDFSPLPYDPAGR